MENNLKAKVAALRNPRRSLKWLHGEVNKVLNDRGKKICKDNFYKIVQGNYNFLTAMLVIEIAEELLIKQELQQYENRRKRKEA